MNTPIGGYFELELPKHQEFHSDAIALNSGRFCLEYILRCRKVSKLYVPYYTCDSAVEPIIKLGIPYEFYHIDEEYHIVDDIRLSEGEALMYTNYWGLQSDYCRELFSKYGNKLILDYTQSFFAKPIPGADTFYSCRKFFGVPDGGYLYTDADADADLNIKQDVSFSRMDSLVKRIDLSPEEGYEDFRKISEEFHKMSIRHMSRFTKRMMQSIDYDEVAQKRRDNYEKLRKALGGKELSDNDVPMVFPYMANDGQALRRHMIQNRIFVPTYWPNVYDWTGEDSVEAKMAKNIIPLPIDQRYGIDDINLICNIIQ